MVGVCVGACHPVVESTFLIVVAGARQVRPFRSCQTGLDMAFKFFRAAEGRWQRIGDPYPVTFVQAGIRFSQHSP